MTDGNVIRDDTGTRLVFERSLPHSRARIWQAITDPEQRAQWFFAGTLEPVVGGRVDLEDHGPGITGEVTAVENEALLAFTWSSIDGPTSSVRFELSEDHRGGTRLVFTHFVNDDCRPLNLLPGWHAIFDDLERYLHSGWVSEQPGRHDRLHEHYLHGATPADSTGGPP